MAVWGLLGEIGKEIIKEVSKEPFFTVESERESGKRPHFVVENVGDKVAKDIVLSPNFEVQFEPFDGERRTFKIDAIFPGKNKKVYYERCGGDSSDVIEMEIYFYKGDNRIKRYCQSLEVYL